MAISLSNDDDAELVMLMIKFIVWLTKWYISFFFICNRKQNRYGHIIWNDSYSYFYID